MIAVKAVAIDLDGTLLNTAPDLAEAANRMLSDLQMASVSLSQVMSYIGNGAEKLVKRLLTGEMESEPDAGLLKKAMNSFFENYADVLHVKSELYPGVRDGLDLLQNGKFRMACITNKPEKFTIPLLKAMNLYDYFEIVLSGDSLPRKKPDPLPLYRVCEEFGIKPNELLMIGDSISDVEAARSAGSYIFSVPYGYNSSSGTLKSDREVSSILEAAKLLMKA